MVNLLSKHFIQSLLSSEVYVLEKCLHLTLVRIQPYIYHQHYTAWKGLII